MNGKMRDETLPCFWFSTSLFLFFGIIMALLLMVAIGSHSNCFALFKSTSLTLPPIVAIDDTASVILALVSLVCT